MGIAGNIGRVLQGAAAPPPEPPVEGSAFDPGAVTVDEVKAYLGATDDPVEWARVRTAEELGKNRVTLLAWIEENEPA